MLRPVGFETLAIPAEVVQLKVPRGAEFAVASLEGGSIRFRDDGASVPEETIGVRLADGTIFEICANSLDKARFTLEAGDDVFLQVSYYGR
jgi:hypothetical protein